MATQLRAATTSERDVDFLREMLYEAFSWRPGLSSPPFAEALSNPAISLYVEDWGRPGDAGVIAEADTGGLVGAAWYRLFTTGEHGYGFVAPPVPEITIGVRPSDRGRGTGTLLLAALIDRARREHHASLSLSVEEDNLPAVRLYERLGFSRVGRVGNAWTMQRDLATQAQSQRH